MEAVSSSTRVGPPPRQEDDLGPATGYFHARLVEPHEARWVWCASSTRSVDAYLHRERALWLAHELRCTRTCPMAGLAARG